MVRIGPITGLIAQVVLLGGLAGTVGLGGAGWLAGLAYGAVMCTVLSRGLGQAGARGLGPADWVTLTRATLAGGVAALTVDSFDRPAPVAVLVTLAAVALVLDGVDGQVARRTGTVTALGARFDMEVDAFLVLVLSVHVAPALGAWVLTFGLMRYAFVVATWALPWMRGSLPPRYWRKVVAATQGVVLVVATARVLPTPLLVAALIAALAMLVESFGRDVAWLWQHGHVQAAPRHRAAPSPRVGSATGRRTRLPLTIKPDAVVVREETVSAASN
ncbi:MAG: hypothetical protein V7603_4436 [Micromonosporaceae bacterium]